MSSVYPRADVKAAPQPIDLAACAERIILAREANPNASKALIVGIVLQGSDDVEGFEIVWAEVEAERIAMAAVDASKSAMRSAYESALGAKAKYLDQELFADGAIAAAGAETWTEFKAGMATAKEL